MPKQFVPLVEDRSTFQQVLDRINDDEIFDRPIVITNSDFRFIVAEQLRECGIQADIVLEPMRRDSAMAVAVAAALAYQRNPEAPVLVLAADHVLRNSAGFKGACREASGAVNEGLIVTFGIYPNLPSNELRLYQARRQGERWGGACGRGLRGKTGR